MILRKGSSLGYFQAWSYLSSCAIWDGHPLTFVGSYLREGGDASLSGVVKGVWPVNYIAVC